jgi:hypothetical protein
VIQSMNGQIVPARSRVSTRAAKTDRMCEAGRLGLRRIGPESYHVLEYPSDSPQSSNGQAYAKRIP